MNTEGLTSYAGRSRGVPLKQFVSKRTASELRLIARRSLCATLLLMYGCLLMRLTAAATNGGALGKPIKPVCGGCALVTLFKA